MFTMTGPEELITASGNPNGLAFTGIVTPPTTRLVTLRVLGGVEGTTGEKGAETTFVPMKDRLPAKTPGLKLSKRIRPSDPGVPLLLALPAVVVIPPTVPGEQLNVQYP
jgi:hypothetical protein